MKPYPKSQQLHKKEKADTKSFAYWNSVKKKSLEKRREKMKVSGIPAKDKKFYLYLWKVKEHFCENCGAELILKEGNDCRDFAHHELPKKQFPYFRWDERNIIFLCGRFGCHGKAESAISYPKMKIYARCEAMKKKLLDEV